MSWPDRLIHFVDRTPLPAWLVYALVGAALIIVVHVNQWLCGVLPYRAISIPVAIAALWSVLLLGLLDYSYRIARRALDDFKPALGDGASIDPKLVRTLTSLPPRPALLAVLIGAVYLAAVILYDRTFFGLLTGNPCSDALLYVLGTANCTMIILACYQSVRNLVAVDRVQGMVTRPDLFQRHPLFAFSQLTSYIAITIALSTYLFWFAFPSTLVNPLAYGLMFLVVLPLALIAFSAPLAEMHRRMVAEKVRLLAETSQRMKDVRDMLHRHYDEMDFSKVDSLNKVMASLVLEEEYIRKMRTWPWEPATLSSVLTATILPIALFIIERLLTRTLGW